MGGGIAGIAAAVALAERGVGVQLLEREPQLGGRLRGWPIMLADGSPATMSRGFHAFFRQYYNLRALLRRADPLGRALVPMTDYPLIDADGHRDTFQGLPRTPPWNALAFALLSPTFQWRDLVTRIDPVAALPLVDVSVPEIYRRLDDQDAMTFLERVRFPDAARHLAFSVFSRSFFADPRELSAAELATMFHIYFLGSAEGLVFDVTPEPFPQALWDPMGGYLTELGVSVRAGVAVEQVTPGRERRFAVHAGGDSAEVDAVVLAADVTGLQAVLAASPELGEAPWRAQIARLRTAPPFLVSRLWLDHPVNPERPGFLGTSGFGPLDNVSVLERFEGEAARWARRTGGSVVELHAYALTGDPQQAKRAARRRAAAGLPGDRHRHDHRRAPRSKGRLPVVRTRDLRRPAHRHHPRSERGARRGPDPGRPPRRTDGTRGDQRLPRRRRAASTVAVARAPAVDGAGPRPARPTTRRRSPVRLGQAQPGHRPVVRNS